MVGFLIGVIGGFFGVGGSFIAGPALRAVGWIGISPSAQIWRTSSENRWWRQNVIARSATSICVSGLIMAMGTIGGAEVGAQLIQMLKRAGNVNSSLASSRLSFTSAFRLHDLGELRKLSCSSRNDRATSKIHGTGTKTGRFFFQPRHRSHPTLANSADDSLPASGVTISLWIILLVSFIGGLFSGFLGGGAGYIRMPSMVYVLGIPTHLAVGTDLFEIIISASYGTFSSRDQRQCRHSDCAGHEHGRRRSARKSAPSRRNILPGRKFVSPSSRFR